MSLEELITEGEAARKSCFEDSSMGGYISGEDYEKWIAKGLLYMQKNHVDIPIYQRFLEASKNAAGNGTEYYDRMMGILKELKVSQRLDELINEYSKLL